MSPQHLTKCCKKAVLNSGGCILAQSGTKRWCVTHHCTHKWDLLLHSLDTRHQESTFTKTGDPVWVKPPQSRCTTQYHVGWVTGIRSQHIVIINGRPHHIKDLWPDSSTSVSDSSSKSSKSERLIGTEKSSNTSSEESTSKTSRHTPAYTLDNSSESCTSEETVVVVLRRNTRLKRPAPSCHLYEAGVGWQMRRIGYQRTIIKSFNSLLVGYHSWKMSSKGIMKNKKKIPKNKFVSFGWSVVDGGEKRKKRTNDY